jgi:hypothetical protein
LAGLTRFARLLIPRFTWLLIPSLLVARLLIPGLLIALIPLITELTPRLTLLALVTLIAELSARLALVTLLARLSRLAWLVPIFALIARLTEFALLALPAIVALITRLPVLPLVTMVPLIAIFALIARLILIVSPAIRMLLRLMLLGLIMRRKRLASLRPVNVAIVLAIALTAELALLTLTVGHRLPGRQRSHHQAIIVLGMLQIILGADSVARRMRIARKLLIFFVNMRG